MRWLRGSSARKNSRSDLPLFYCARQRPSNMLLSSVTEFRVVCAIVDPESPGPRPPLNMATVLLFSRPNVVSAIPARECGDKC